jgi:large subunit ribosomal protein L9
MEVILREDIPNLGRMGELVRVKNGYARNYLLPRGLVMVANKKNLNVLEHQKRVISHQKEHVLKAAQTLSEKLAAVTLTMPVKVGEEGRLFGSVTNIDIDKALREKGFDIERRRIELNEPIKTVGEYEISIRLTAEVTTHVKLSVISEKAEPASA